LCNVAGSVLCSLMACHVMILPVYITNSVKRLYASLDVTMFINPDAVCCGAIYRCSHMALCVMLSWRDGYPLQWALPMPWLWNSAP